MTVYFSYIGDLDDPDFQWDDPPQSPSASNLPRRLVPADPPRGRQLDWGAWGMVMTGAALAEMFGAAHRYADAIAALDRDTAYVLVAGEMW